MKGDDISDRLADFSVRIIRLANSLPNDLVGKLFAGQLLTSGTSPSANYEEARGTESRADFTHKLRITLEELRESLYWLRVIRKAELLPPESIEDLSKETTELSNIIAQSIPTARKNENQ